MSIPAAWPQVLDFFGTPLVIEPSVGQLSGDAGLLPIRQFDDRTGLTRAFADALDDPRDLGRVEHPFPGMASARVSGILAVRRRDGPAVRDRAVGVEVATQEFVRFGLIDVPGPPGCAFPRGHPPKGGPERFSADSVP